MRKVFYLGLIGVFLIQLKPASGQDFTFLKDSISKTGSSGQIIAPGTKIVNKTNGSVTFRWVRGKAKLPNDWQKPGFCDKNQCYNDKDSATFKLNGKDSARMKINFYAYNANFEPKKGKGYSNIIVYPVSKGRAASQKVFFKGEATGSSGVEKTTSALNFKIYPNPVNKVLNLEFPSVNRNRQVVIFNALGKPVKRLDCSGIKSKEVPVSELPKGNYFIRYQDKEGASITKSFTKD